MDIVAVAKNKEIACEIAETVKAVFSDATVTPYDNPLWVCTHTAFNKIIDIVIITDEQKCPMGCLELAEWLRNIFPDIIIVFLVETEESCIRARENYPLETICSFSTLREALVEIQQMCS